jgi:methylmalonyl-CoA mutase N-terminal domain/subunit
MTERLKSAVPSKSAADASDPETSSHIPVRSLYTSADLKNWDQEREVGYPGEYPFTRGVQATMYRGRLWTMRQYAGMGDADESNKRYKYLLANGTTGLSVAFDLPTQIGLDSRQPRPRGSGQGWCRHRLHRGHVQRLFDGIDLTKISTSMTINATASIILLALYVAVANGRVRYPQTFRYRAKRRTEGIHRTGHLHLPTAAGHAHHYRSVRLD